MQGYQGAFGANTFSRVGDLGVSSYLGKRMKYATPYVLPSEEIAAKYVGIAMYHGNMLLEALFLSEK